MRRIEPEGGRERARRDPVAMRELVEQDEQGLRALEQIDPGRLSGCLERRVVGVEELTLAELEKFSGCKEWVDVCKDWAQPQ